MEIQHFLFLKMKIACCILLMYQIGCSYLKTVSNLFSQQKIQGSYFKHNKLSSQFLYDNEYRRVHKKVLINFQLYYITFMFHLYFYFLFFPNLWF